MSNRYVDCKRFKGGDVKGIKYCVETPVRRVLSFRAVAGFEASLKAEMRVSLIAVAAATSSTAILAQQQVSNQVNPSQTSTSAAAPAPAKQPAPAKRPVTAQGPENRFAPVSAPGATGKR